MKLRTLVVAVGLVTGLTSLAPVAGADQTGHSASQQGEQTILPTGVIGVSLHVGAERIGDPALLYVGMVHPEGPAHQAGLAHGDEIHSVDGTAVSGKTYEQVVTMIRGEAGTTVKLGLKGERGQREVSVTRIAQDKLPRGPKGSHGGPPKKDAR